MSLFCALRRSLRIMRPRQQRSDCEEPNRAVGFQRANPCPSTGEATGPCPGYIANHVIPLQRGGRDAVENVQWQSLDQARAKDRTE